MAQIVAVELSDGTDVEQFCRSLISEGAAVYEIPSEICDDLLTLEALVENK